jgi:hypothetical protein
MKEFDKIEIIDLLNNMTNTIDVINEDIASINAVDTDKIIIDGILYEVQELYIMLSSLENEIL